MTKPNVMNGREITEHSPDQYFQNWTLDNLPDSKNFWISDVDMVLRDRQNIAIVEIKRLNGKLKPSQSITYQYLDFVLKSFHQKPVPISINGYKTTTTLNYRGFFVLTLSGTTFEDSETILINGIEQTESEVINLLSFK